MTEKENDLQFTKQIGNKEIAYLFTKNYFDFSKKNKTAEEIVGNMMKLKKY